MAGVGGSGSGGTDTSYTRCHTLRLRQGVTDAASAVKACARGVMGAASAVNALGE